MPAKYPAIPEPTVDPVSLRESAMATKQAFEILTGARGGKPNAAVTWQDLLDLGLVTKLQVPR